MGSKKHRNRYCIFEIQASVDILICSNFDPRTQTWAKERVQSSIWSYTENVILGIALYQVRHFVRHYVTRRRYKCFVKLFVKIDLVLYHHNLS